jgi:hypothetical protein
MAANIVDNLSIDAKLGSFWGNPKMDKVSPNQWLATATKLHDAQTWDDARTFSIIKMTLQGDAAKWFAHQVTNYFGRNITTWVEFRERFIKEYDFKSIQAVNPYPVIRAITQGGNESVQSFNRRIEIMNLDLLTHCANNQQFNVTEEQLGADVVCRTAHANVAAAWTAIPLAGKQIIQANIARMCQEQLEAAIRKGMFLGGMKDNVKKMISHVDVNTTSTNDIVKEAGIKEAIAELPKTNLAQIDEDTEQVEAVAKGKKKKPKQKKPANQNSNTKDSDMSKVECRYCKKMGHGQFTCYTRIRKGDPAIDEQGKPFAKDSVPWFKAKAGEAEFWKHNKPNRSAAKKVAEVDNAQDEAQGDDYNSAASCSNRSEADMTPNNWWALNC